MSLTESVAIPPDWPGWVSLLRQDPQPIARLFFADWLERIGQAAWSRLLRLQIAREQLPDLHPARNQWGEEIEALQAAVHLPKLLQPRSRDFLFCYRLGLPEVWHGPIDQLPENGESFSAGLGKRYRPTELARTPNAAKLLPFISNIPELDLCGQEDAWPFLQSLLTSPLPTSALDLSFVNLKDAELNTLAKNWGLSNLKRLDLNDNPSLTAAAFHQLGQRGRLQQLQHLDLSSNQLDGRDIQSLLAYQSSDPQAYWLCHQNPIGPDGFRAWVSRPVCPNFRADDCQLNATAIAYLNDCPARTTIQSLNLANNRFGLEGVRELVQIEFPSLLTLSLAGNNLPDEVWLLLVRAPWFGQLELLDVSGNYFSEKTLEKIRKYATDSDWREPLTLIPEQAEAREVENDFSDLPEDLRLLIEEAIKRIEGG